MSRTLATTLALLVALAPLASAQEPPRSDAAKKELAELTAALRKDALDRVLRSIVANLAETDPAKAQLVRAKTASRTFLEKHQDAELETTLSDLFASELDSKKLRADDLKVDFQLYRRYRDGYEVRSVDPKRVPKDRTGFEPPRTRGYLPEVAAIDATAAHSMHDIHDYLDDRLTNAALDRMASSDRVVEVHVGDELDALSDLRNRGWNVFGEVRSPNGTYERLFLAESPKGEVRYVVSGDVEGQDRVRHLSALLRFAGEAGVASSRVELVGDPGALEARRLSELQVGLERLPLGGETAIIGFRSGMKTELLKRALARRGLERVREVLGARPHLALVKKLEAERDAARGAARKALSEAVDAVKGDATLARALQLDPATVFRSTKNTEDVVKAERVLVALAKANPGSNLLGSLVAGEKLRVPGGGAAEELEVARDIEAGSLRADEVLAKTPSGVRSVLLVNNHYGDAMGPVVRALLATGRRRIAYFGTAGGIASDARVGDIHVPATFLDQKGSAVDAKNAFIEFLEGKTTTLGERLVLGTKVGNVYSPLEESMSWLEGARHGGLDAVEVETSYIAKEVAAYNESAAAARRAKLYGSVIISDVPGSDATLGNNSGKTQATFVKMLDQYLEALGIDDVMLQPASEDPANKPALDDPRRKRALEVAEKLVPRDLPRSTNLRDRIAAILGKLPQETLDRIDTSRKLEPSEVPGLSAADRQLLEREVANAVTDAGTTAALEKVNAVLSRLASELREKHPRAELELRVGGGVESGSFSPARGVVLEVRGSEETRQSAAEILASVLAGVKDAPPVVLGEAGEGALSLGDGAVFKSEPEPLLRLHALRALARRGAIVRESSVEYAGREHTVSRVAEVVAERTGMTPEEVAKALATRGVRGATSADGLPPLERRRGIVDSLVEERVRAGRVRER